MGAAGLAVAALVGFVQPGTGNAGDRSGVPVFKPADLAVAVLFNDGPAAGYLSSLNRPRPERTDVLLKSEAAVAEAVAGWRAGSSFAEQIQSGDPVKVQDALRQLAVLAKDVLEKLYGKDLILQAVDRVIDGISKQHLITAITLDSELSLYNGDILWIDNDVALYVEVAAAAFAVVFAAIVWPAEPGAAKVLDLVQEVMIRNIAVNLQAKAY
ncbi:hypothetical protein [Catellatospora sp. TT07R-123]|uniref:hypothetical protein n=1 Tax=Catellatospora sp. TT07R-123 TaxID=2733863 RepID=UPI001BB328A1|nr:hypothetical protein [Catellatospora sp. TT07R-123]